MLNILNVDYFKNIISPVLKANDFHDSEELENAFDSTLNRTIFKSDEFSLFAKDEYANLLINAVKCEGVDLKLLHRSLSLNSNLFDAVVEQLQNDEDFFNYICSTNAKDSNYTSAMIYNANLARKYCNKTEKTRGQIPKESCNLLFMLCCINRGENIGDLCKNIIASCKSEDDLTVSLMILNHSKSFLAFDVDRDLIDSSVDIAFQLAYKNGHYDTLLNQSFNNIDYKQDFVLSRNDKNYTKTIFEEMKNDFSVYVLKAEIAQGVLRADAYSLNMYGYLLQDISKFFSPSEVVSHLTSGGPMPKFKLTNYIVSSLNAKLLELGEEFVKHSINAKIDLDIPMIDALHNGGGDFVNACIVSHSLDSLMNDELSGSDLKCEAAISVEIDTLRL